MTRGGARAGAGRPRKFDFWYMTKVGQACEALWREASNKVVQLRLSQLKHAARINDRHERSRKEQIDERATWTRSVAFHDMVDDTEADLHDRAGTKPNPDGTFDRPAPRLSSVSNKPLKGTRKRVIAEVAANTSLNEKQVDNLWQAYRRYERSLKTTMNIDF